MNKSTKPQASPEDVTLLMKATLGATVLSLVTSFSTHHVTAASHNQIAAQRHEVVMTPAEVSHLFEREREVLHAHTSLGRTRYATVSGTSG